jgi:WS/DGAT/MGAT family acyltransferase
VASRLHRLPRYRQRLAWIPVEGHPVWVDDPHFQIDYHVRHTALPRPGDERQLKRMAGRLVSQPLDRERPLWEFWLVEGLEGGKRFAIVQKVHHCMIDGIAGVDLMAILLASDPEAEPEPSPPFEPRPSPGPIDLLASEVGRRVTGLVAALGRAPGALREPADLAGRVREGVGAVRETLSAALRPASNTPINQKLGPHRRLDWRDLELSRVKAVKDRLGGTVNDVVLAVVAGALSRWLRKSRQTDVDELDFKVMTPVSLRMAGERGRLGNRVAAWFVPLPLAEHDRRRRYQLVREATARLKKRHEALGGETITQVVEWLGPAPVSLAARYLQGASPFNMVVTNVPGPRTPLYLLGARMLEAHPLVPLLGTLGLGIALLSYERTLSWGFTADWDLVPDLHELVVDVAREFTLLREVAESV